MRNLLNKLKYICGLIYNDIIFSDLNINNMSICLSSFRFSEQYLISNSFIFRDNMLFIIKEMVDCFRECYLVYTLCSNTI